VAELTMEQHSQEGNVLLHIKKLIKPVGVLWAVKLLFIVSRCRFSASTAEAGLV